MMLTESQVQQRTVILYPDEDNYWVVEVPSLPGCISQGETKEEALTNIQEAISLYLEVLEERGQVIPQANLSIAQDLVEKESRGGAQEGARAESRTEDQDHRGAMREQG